MSDCPLVGCTDVYSRCDDCYSIERVQKVGTCHYTCVDQAACGRRILEQMCRALRECHEPQGE